MTKAGTQSEVGQRILHDQVETASCQGLLLCGIVGLILSSEWQPNLRILGCIGSCLLLQQASQPPGDECPEAMSHLHTYPQRACSDNFYFRLNGPGSESSRPLRHTSRLPAQEVCLQNAFPQLTAGRGKRVSLPASKASRKNANRT